MPIKKTIRSAPKKINPQKIFSALHARWPNAKCELVHNTPFQLLLCVALSAQTTDISVNKAMTPIYENKPDFSPSDLLAMGEKKFFEAIRFIGLAPTKAKNAIKMAEILIEKFDGGVPLEREALELLPGVGRKTANVVLNVVLQEITMPVDTHVERLAKRIGLVARPKSRLEIEKKLLEIVPREYGVVGHHLLIFHGRYLCTARSPKCSECPIEGECAKIDVAKDEKTKLKKKESKT